MKSNFCPAPWNSLYYNTDTASVCCVNKHRTKCSPKEFLNSQFLHELRTNISNDVRDESCASCWQAEDVGLQSIRKHYISRYKEFSSLQHMEIRASNLCNFACIMCDAESSSRIANQVFNITDDNWNEILEFVDDVKTLFITGGEPMLIKRYYDLLDYLVDKDRKDISLNIYTNCSVVNQKFIDRITKLNTTLHLSIDGVDVFAEKQRVGTNWQDVRKNVLTFMQLPVKTEIHTTLTAFSIIGIESMAKFLCELHEVNPTTRFKAHTITSPAKLTCDKAANVKVIHQIDAAISILKQDCFEQYRNELMSVKNMLSSKLKP